MYFNLGMLAMDDRNTEEAEHFFRRAIHIKEDFRSALFNLALLLADDHRPLEAAPFLNQLVKYHPDHVKGFILLGDIYINNLKDIDAAENVSFRLEKSQSSFEKLQIIIPLVSLQCYKRILQLDPVNIQGLHNLCVVYVERGFLAKAHACLHEAHKLAPTEDYIIKHLQIIETRLAKLKAHNAPSREKELAFADYDPREFGGHAMKDNKVNLKVSQFASSIKTQAELLHASKDPVFLEPNLSENYQKRDSLKRIQNNYATDLDDPSSGMS